MSRVNLHQCERLTVYGTSGEQFYPDPDGAARPEVSDWFTRDGLVGYLDTRDGELMVYTGDVRHPDRIDQAFAVYDGVAAESIVSDFERDVSQCLVEERDWELIEATNPTEDKAFFDVLTSSEGELDISEFVSHDAAFVETVLTSDSTEPLVVLAGDYAVAGQLLREYAGLDPVRVNVYHESSPSLPERVDLGVSVQPGPYDVRVPEESEQTLEDRRTELDRIHATERADETVERIAAHAEAGDDVSVVTDAVERGFAEHYGEHEVLRAETVARREREREELNQEADVLAEEVASLESALTEKESQIARLRKDAKLARGVRRVKRTLRNPTQFFYVETDRPIGGGEPTDRHHRNTAGSDGGRTLAGEEWGSEGETSAPSPDDSPDRNSDPFDGEPSFASEPETRLSWWRVGGAVAVLAAIAGYLLLQFVFQVSTPQALEWLWGRLPFLVGLGALV